MDLVDTGRRVQGRSEALNTSISSVRSIGQQNGKIESNSFTHDVDTTYYMPS